jgi:hypothetical protein
MFYEFKLDAVVPKDHLLRRMNFFVTSVFVPTSADLSVAQSGSAS